MAAVVVVADQREVTQPRPHREGLGATTLGEQEVVLGATREEAPGLRVVVVVVASILRVGVRVETEPSGTPRTAQAVAEVARGSLLSGATAVYTGAVVVAVTTILWVRLP